MTDKAESNEIQRIFRQEYRRKNRFGGLYYAVLERDNYTCKKCGLTNDENMKKYGRSISIDHIDGVGRNSKRPNNTMENLQTLCLSCHSKKDGRRKAKLSEEDIPKIRALIKFGFSQYKIGRLFKVSRSSICLIARRVTWADV